MHAVHTTTARDLARRILRSNRREVEEVYLAVLLPLLAGTALEEAGELLTELGLIEHPPARWIAGLARRLRLERRSNAIAGLPIDPGRLDTTNVAPGERTTPREDNLTVEWAAA